MSILKIKHAWKLSPGQAKKLQLKLRKKLVLRKDFGKISLIAAADASFKNGKAQSAVAVFKYPGLELVECQTATASLTFPYIPGLLTFREGPVLIKAFSKLKNDPDLIIFDGQGIAHPLRFGIASHLGVIFNKPAVGSAKSRLVGTYREPKKKRGSFTLLRQDGKIIGAVVRTQTGVKPIFVSQGNRIDLKSAIKIILACSKRYRVPEPIRFVHNQCSLS